MYYLVLEEGDSGHDGVEVGGEEGEVEPGGGGEPDPRLPDGKI